MFNVQNNPAYFNNPFQFRGAEKSFMQEINDNIYKHLCIPLQSMYDIMFIFST